MAETLLAILLTLNAVQGVSFTSTEWDRDIANPVHAMDPATRDDLRVGLCVEWPRTMQSKLPDVCRQ